MDITQNIKKEKVEVKEIDVKNSIKSNRNSSSINPICYIYISFCVDVIYICKNPQEMMQLPPTIIPKEIVLENYSAAWNSGPFFRYLLNSIFVTGSILIIQFVVMVPAAYAFSKIKFKGEKYYLEFYL